MSLIFNTKSPIRVKYNTNDVRRVIYNGTEVWRMVPSTYQELEYLQSDGACYIDTGRVPNNNDIIEQKFKKMGTSTETCAWYGSMPSSNTTTPRIGFGSYQAGMFCGTNTTAKLKDSLDTNVHVAKFHVLSSTTLEVTFDGETEVVSASGGGSNTLLSPAIELTSYLFARHGVSGVQTYDNEGTRIYHHKEYLNDGTIALDLVPVRRISDGKLGMYDLVAKIFHPGYGSGTFTGGPLADFPSDYTKLQSLIFSGDQYLDLGYKPNSNTKLTLKYYPYENDKFMCLYGCQTSTSEQRFYGLVSSTQYKLQLNFTNATKPNFIGVNNDGTVEPGTNGTFTDDQKDVELYVSKDVVTIKTTNQNLSYNMTTVENWGVNVNCEYDMILGSRSTAGDVANGFVGKIYYTIIQENNTIKYNLIPAKRNSDNVLGMYDTITHTFFTNAGTGTFTSGGTE